MTLRYDRLAFLVPAAVVTIAILPLPYGYYTFVRLVVPIAAAIAAWAAYAARRSVDWQCVLWGLIALLFNPIFPVGLTRGVWFPIDLTVAAAFAVRALWRTRA